MNRKPGTVAILACILLSGCHVDTRNNGTNNNVDIKTPFGSLKVDTSDSSDVADIGLSPYPGAAPLKDSGDKDDNAANVNMNFGSFRLGVKTAFFQTPDSQDKVIEFYRKNLAQHFGDVIECRDDKPVGTPIRTAQGLTCGSTRDKHYVQLGPELNHKNLQLRTGSERHQHIVTMEDHDGGTKIGLIALDLPSHLSGLDGRNSAE
jgi:hypothetical protein